MFEVVLCRIARLHLLPQITPRQSSPRRLRASHFAVSSGFVRQSICCATGLPRRNLGFAEMKTGGGCFNSSEYFSQAQNGCRQCRLYFSQKMRQHLFFDIVFFYENFQIVLGNIDKFFGFPSCGKSSFCQRQDLFIPFILLHYKLLSHRFRKIFCIQHPAHYENFQIKDRLQSNFSRIKIALICI